MNNLCYPDEGIVWTEAEETTAALPSSPPDLLEICEAFAWITLQTLSGYRIGLCPITVRPTTEPRYFAQSNYSGSLQYVPAMLPSGAWINLVDRNGLWVNHRELHLPGPVGYIDNVTIDGVALPATAYRVDNGNILVRQDGDVWPNIVDTDLPLGEVGTFSVTYLQGYDTDVLVNNAANILAHEEFKSLTGDKTCRLPAGTKTISRQGVTYDLVNDLYDNGFTGLRDVDKVITRFNPYLLKSPTIIASPDTINRSRQATYGRV